MNRWVGKVAVVTGASSGIGEAIAETLVKAGLQVIGLARRVERVQKAAEALTECEGKLHAFQCDITSEEDIVKAFEWTTKNVGNVHVLVNNAGILRDTTLLDGDAKKWKDTFDTNVLGLCIATREATKLMMAQNIPGQIIHISSLAGTRQLYFPSINVYGASKHAVGNLTDMLRQELNAKNSQIKVANICPGAVSTEIMTGDSFPKEMRDLMKDIEMLESQDIADAVLYVLNVPQRVNINEITITPTGSRY